MAVVYLEDLITQRKVVAEAYMGEGGGWRISISPYSFIYGRLKENPKAFVGMVFRDTTGEAVHGGDKVLFVKITQAAPRWVRVKPKVVNGRLKTELPFLDYLAVKWEPIYDQLAAIEALEQHRQKLEGDFKEEKDATNESD
jgi:hypothetical protein